MNLIVTTNQQTIKVFWSKDNSQSASDARLIELRESCTCTKALYQGCRK